MSQRVPQKLRINTFNSILSRSQYREMYIHSHKWHYTCQNPSKYYHPNNSTLISVLAPQINSWSSLFGLKICATASDIWSGPAARPRLSPLLDLSGEKENNPQIPVYQCTTGAARDRCREGQGGYDYNWADASSSLCPAAHHTNQPWWPKCRASTLEASSG